jgi:hypothetical protein
MMLLPIILSFVAGIFFGIGLSIADMVNPARILNFLDVTGSWDPTLAFVMLGAMAVTIPGYRFVLKRGRPAVADNFRLPQKVGVDRQLIVGSAVFGVGWGLAGYCPGPAFAALWTMETKVWLFVLAMSIGVSAANLLEMRRARRPN